MTNSRDYRTTGTPLLHSQRRTLEERLLSYMPAITPSFPPELFATSAPLAGFTGKLHISCARTHVVHNDYGHR